MCLPRRTPRRIDDDYLSPQSRGWRKRRANNPLGFSVNTLRKLLDPSRDILAREKALTDGWRLHEAGKPCPKAGPEREGWQDREAAVRSGRATKPVGASAPEPGRGTPKAQRTPRP